MPAPPQILELVERFRLYRDPAYNETQLRRYAWSAKLPLSILTDFEEFAVYNCRARPTKNDNPSKQRRHLAELSEQMTSLHEQLRTARTLQHDPKWPVESKQELLEEIEARIHRCSESRDNGGADNDGMS